MMHLTLDQGIAVTLAYTFGYRSNYNSLITLSLTIPNTLTDESH